MKGYQVLGNALTERDYAIISELAKSAEPIKVIPLGERLRGKYSHHTLYGVLENLNRLRLVIKDPRTEKVQGKEFRQIYWSVTAEAKEALAAS